MPDMVAAQLGDLQSLEESLGELLTKARSAWPSFDLAPDLFFHHIAERLPASEARRALDAVHAPDLYLACACLHGHPQALAEFHEKVLPSVIRSVERRAGTTLAGQEVISLLVQKLLVAGNHGPAKIGEFSGRGSLVGWVRAVATRLLFDEQRLEKEVVAVDDRLADRLAGGEVSPEVAFVKRQYRGAFATAFRGAIEGLSSRDRTILRMHALEGMTIDQIGAFYNVHRTTAFRWVAAARVSVLSQTRKSLVAQLGLDGGELDSLIGDLQSQLDTNVSSYLKSR